MPQYQWPKSIQDKFDNEYFEFLKAICNNKPNLIRTVRGFGYVLDDDD